MHSVKSTTGGPMDQASLNVVEGASPPTNSSRKRLRRQLVGGQAIVELAIFGSVMLGALAFLVRVGMTWNFQQEARMASFRRALATSHDDDAKMRGIDGAAETEWYTGIHDAVATTFLSISDRQMPDPSDGFMSMPRSRTSAASFVEWGNRLTFAHAIDNEGNDRVRETGWRTQQHIVVRINQDTEASYRQDDFARDIECGDVESTTDWLMARVGIVTRQEITNQPQLAHITTTEGTSTLESDTQTESDTTVNALQSDAVDPCTVPFNGDDDTLLVPRAPVHDEVDSGTLNVNWNVP